MANGANGRDEVAVTGPGGFGASLRGQNVLIPLLLAASLLGVIYFSLEDHRQILSGQNQLVSAVRVQNWLLSLPPDKRPPLPPPLDALRATYGKDFVPEATFP